MNYLIKYASRGRPKWFKRHIQNIVRTIATKNYLILVSCDVNDATMNNPDIRAFCSHYQIKLCYGNSTSKVEAINADIADCGYKWDILINTSDDMCFVVQAWDKILENKIKSVWGNSLDFFAHFNDGYTKDALATMSILGYDYYMRDGYVYHNSYKSFSCDAEAYYVAILRDKHHYFDTVLFKHQHPANTPLPNDETYRINSTYTKHDTDNYFHRLNNNFFTGFVGTTIFDKHKR